LVLGVAAAVSGSLEITFWLVGGAMFASGLLVALFSEETLPRLNLKTVVGRVVGAGLPAIKRGQSRASPLLRHLQLREIG